MGGFRIALCLRSKDRQDSPSWGLGFEGLCYRRKGVKVFDRGMREERELAVGRNREGG